MRLARLDAPRASCCNNKMNQRDAATVPRAAHRLRVIYRVRASRGMRAAISTCRGNTQQHNIFALLLAVRAIANVCRMSVTAVAYAYAHRANNCLAYNKRGNIDIRVRAGVTATTRRHLGAGWHRLFNASRACCHRVATHRIFNATTLPPAYAARLPAARSTRTCHLSTALPPRGVGLTRCHLPALPRYLHYTYSACHCLTRAHSFRLHTLAHRLTTSSRQLFLRTCTLPRRCLLPRA